MFSNRSKKSPVSERKVHFRENMGKLESQKCMSNFLNDIQVKKKEDKRDTSLSRNSGKWVGLAVLGKFCQGVALGEELLESTSMLSQTKRKFHLRSTWWANEFIKLFYKHGVRVTFKESCDNPRVVIIPPISFISSSKFRFIISQSSVQLNNRPFCINP